MVKCCVYINKDKDKKRGVRFHRLPNDVNIRALWLKQLGLNQADLSSEDICSDHFAYNDYENYMLQDEIDGELKLMRFRNLRYFVKHYVSLFIYM